MPEHATADHQKVTKAVPTATVGVLWSALGVFRPPVQESPTAASALIAGPFKVKSNSHSSRAQFMPNMARYCGPSRLIMVRLFLCT